MQFAQTVALDTANVMLTMSVNAFQKESPFTLVTYMIPRRDTIVSMVTQIQMMLHHLQQTVFTKKMLSHKHSGLELTAV
jgi:hypothetical protein